MTPMKALESAIAAMQDVLREPVSADQLSGPTPCSAFTVDQLGDHIIDTHNLLTVGAGGVEVVVDGTLAERHEAVADAAIAQWATRGTDGTIDVGGNELPAEFGLSLHTLEVLVHGWDLAMSLDRPFDPDDQLVDQMLAFATGFITDDVRGDSDGAPYGPAVAVPADAEPLVALVGLAGRNPEAPLP